MCSLVHLEGGRQVVPIHSTAVNVGFKQLPMNDLCVLQWLVLELKVTVTT